MNKLLFILFLTIPYIGVGQGWEKTYNLSEYDRGNSIQQTNDGGYILTGFISIMEQDIVLVKLNYLGDTLWTNSLIESHDQVGRSVKQTNDSGYIICGTREDNQGNGNIWLIKTDSIGNMIWNVTFGDTSNYSEGFSVEQTLDGGYIITGGTNVDQFPGNSDVQLIKTNGNGVEQWNQTYGGIGEDIGYSVQQTNDGGYIITGVIDGFGSNQGEVYLVKTDSTGVELWNNSFGGTSVDIGYSVQQTLDGGYIITGYTWGGSNGQSDIYTIKTDNNGVEVWSNHYGGTDQDYSKSVQQTTDGGYIICGETSSFGTTSDVDVYLIKLNNLGVEQWNQRFGIGDYDEGNYVQQTSDGGYIITGRTRNSNLPPISWDIYVIKTDGNGNITSTFNIPISSNRKLKKVVDILGKETKPQTNTPFIEIYDDGSTEKKLIIEK